ncbi:hypothetical protein CR513_32472, partial [Mucuna pruriens]
MWPSPVGSEEENRYHTICARNLFSLIGIRKGTNRHGFLGDDADLRSDRNHRKPLHQNLLQQRTFCQFISPNFGNYCNNLLLDDGGTVCISCWIMAFQLAFLLLPDFSR